MEWNKIVHGDCIEIIKSLPPTSIDLVFADPPFNISLKGYDNYTDNLTPEQYLTWTQQWLNECARVLKDNGSIYVAISDEFAAELAIELKKRFTMRNWLCWHFGFGQQTKSKFARTKTHILYFVKNPKNFTFNADQIKIPSMRQLKYGDKRAASSGKVPDDIFDFPQEDEVPNDIWKISRIAGTFHERIKDADGSAHPCQMNSDVLRRIIKASSNEGETVLDPFAGTGTTAAVAHELHRHWLTIDKSRKYCQVVAKRIFGDETRFIEHNQGNKGQNDQGIYETPQDLARREKLNMDE